MPYPLTTYPKDGFTSVLGTNHGRLVFGDMQGCDERGKLESNSTVEGGSGLTKCTAEAEESTQGV